MKRITANKLNRLWQNGVLVKLEEKISRTKVLKTLEEVKANTSAENIVNANVAKELINNSMFPDGVKFYPDVQNGVRGYNTDAARGADTFYPFSIGSVEYIDSNIVRKSSESDVASISKSYTVTEKGTLLIFSAIVYTANMNDSLTVNGKRLSPNFTKTASGVYASFYNIPVKKGDSIKLSLSASNIANYTIATSYFMAIAK